MIEHAASIGPLTGFVILDVSRVLSGPYCTMMLCDLGAHVIKIEQPGTGDEARQFLPISSRGESAYFAAINRGKKSIALDLKASADRVVFEQLLSRADVLVENFRPGVLDKLGYGFGRLEQQHPALVLASISGFGQTGPYRTRAAYDVVVQAMSGMMSITGQPESPPSRAGSSIGDLAAAIFACNGIQAALLQRSRTGKGCHVDISMFEAQIALLEGAIPEVFCTGLSPGPIGARHPGTAPFDAFKAADGYLVIAAGSDHLFGRLAEVLGQPGLTSDPRFTVRRSRVANHAELKSIIETALSAFPIAHWLVSLEEAGVPAGPLNDVAAMMADPQVTSRGILPEIQSTGGQRAPVTPILLSTHAYPGVLPAVPGLDEHRDEILRFARGDAPLDS
ncbi:MAG: CoA transferase [Burkholderiaceae bacterium]|nr:CoA transferase [Burkholderiaceae bacterium]